MKKSFITSGPWPLCSPAAKNVQQNIDYLQNTFICSTSKVMECVIEKFSQRSNNVLCHPNKTIWLGINQCLTEGQIIGSL